MRAWIVGVASGFVATGFTADPTAAAGSPASADESYLQQLLGHWRMDGHIGHQPVHYMATGKRVLDAAFVRVSILDADTPSQYQADVYLEFDPTQHDFIVHWLDRFGAHSTRVVGTGARRDNQLVVAFPYSEGNFRDTFTWNATTRGRTLLMQSQDKSGTWTEFGSYTLVPIPPT